MAFPPSFLEELRQRLSIVDVVGRKVRLNRRGNQASGLCPFHNEKSPSFHVYDDGEPHYHCFGCGAHGDVIGFVMNTEGLDFLNAVEKLAGEAGLEVPKETPAERARVERRVTLGSVMEVACVFYQAQMSSSPGEAYLLRRGLTTDAIKKFRLGFSPNSRTGLKSHFEKLGMAEDLAIEAGMLLKPEDGGASYDRFRGRVMFPIMDARGQVIAFGGRALGDDKPKYLNSPETPLFSKGRILYNLNLAQKPARDKSEVIVVEGYMDVIALSEAGFPQAVAPLGTALTEDQIQLLWRLAPEPILCFDGDEAGQKAAAKVAERVLPILRPGFSLQFVNLSDEQSGEKQDPDSFLKKHSPQEFASLLGERKIPLAGILWQILRKDRLTDTPERRAAFKADINRMVSLVVDRTVREEYRSHFQTLAQDISGVESGGIRFAPNDKRRRRWSEPEYQGAALLKRYTPIVWRYLPSFQKDWGGEALVAGFTSLHRQPYEAVIVTLIHHPNLLHRYIEVLKSIEFKYQDLILLGKKIVLNSVENPELSSIALWTLLVQDGLEDTLAKISSKTHVLSFTLPKSDDQASERGLLDVLKYMNGKNLEEELKVAGDAWARDPTDENWLRFETLRDLLLEARLPRDDFEVADLSTSPVNSAG